MKTIIFIPARSGSTRLKNKNIKTFNGEPLIYWTAKIAVKSKHSDKIIFSSDSKSYFNLLKKSLAKNNISTKKIIFDYRNKIQSSKTKKIFDYIKVDLLKKFKFSKKDLLVQMLPTAPLRSLKTVNYAIEKAKKTKKDIFTVNEYDFHLSFALNLFKNNRWKSLFKSSPLKTGNTRSQVQKKFFRPNPIINCIWIRNLNKKRNSIYKNALAIITSRFEGIDIDNEEDFNLAELIKKHKF